MGVKVSCIANFLDLPYIKKSSVLPSAPSVASGSSDIVELIDLDNTNFGLSCINVSWWLQL